MGVGLYRRVRRGLEQIVARDGILEVMHRLPRRRPFILAYHNVVPLGTPDLGDRSLHLELPSFRRQLDILTRRYEILPLEEVVEAGRGSGTGGIAAITFDDAYRGAVTHGLTELEGRGLPATIFVAPALLGEDGFWWDLAAAGLPGGLGDSRRTYALEELGGRSTTVRRWIADLGAKRERPLPPVMRPATEEALVEAAEKDGVGIGSHSWSHPNLCRLSPKELREELERPLAWLRDRVPRVTSCIAYPYGLVSDGVVQAARSAGYRAGVTIRSRGPATGAAPTLRTPRFNVPSELAAEGFALRAGILPLF